MQKYLLTFSGSYEPRYTVVREQVNCFFHGYVQLN